MIIDVDRDAFEYLVGEKEEGHVRSAPWPIHAEKAEHGCGGPIEMGVAVRDQLAGELGGRIDGKRVRRGICFLERKFLVRAIGRTGRCHDEMLCARLT